MTGEVGAVCLDVGVDFGDLCGELVGGRERRRVDYSVDGDSQLGYGGSFVDEIGGNSGDIDVGSLEGVCDGVSDDGRLKTS